MGRENAELAQELVLKRGLVWKRGTSAHRLGGGSWKRRFLVLRPSSLSYHQNSADGAHRQKFIELTQSSEVGAPQRRGGVGGNNQFVLEISTKTFPKLTIRTDTEEESAAWRSAIEGAIRHAPCWTTIKIALVGSQPHALFAHFVANLAFPPKPRRTCEGAKEIVLEMGREWVRIVVLPVVMNAEDAAAATAATKRAFLQSADAVMVVVDEAEVAAVAAGALDALFPGSDAQPHQPHLLVALGGEQARFQQNVDRARALPQCRGFCHIASPQQSKLEVEQVFLDCVGLVMMESEAAPSSAPSTPPATPLRSAKSAISLLSSWTRRANSSSSAKLLASLGKDGGGGGASEEEEEDDDEEDASTSQQQQHQRRPQTEEDDEETEEEEDEDDDDDDAGSMVSVEVDESAQQDQLQPPQDFGMSTAQEDAQYQAKLQFNKQRSSYRLHRLVDLDDIEEAAGDAEALSPKPPAMQLPLTTAITTNQAGQVRQEKARHSVAHFLQRHNKLVEEQLLAMREERQTQQRVLHEAKPLPELSFLEELKLQRKRLPAAATAAAATARRPSASAAGASPVAAQQSAAAVATAGGNVLLRGKTRANAVFFE